MASSDDRINVGPLERALSLAAGALALAAVRRSGPRSAVLLAAGGGLLVYRGLTGRSRLYRALGVSGSDVGRTVSACSQVTVQSSPAKVYRFLRDLSNLTLFSNYVGSAQPLETGRWRLELTTLFGSRHLLEVRSSAQEEDRRLAWATVEGSAFPAALEVRLTEGRWGTEVHADAWWVAPTAPAVSAALRSAERSRPMQRAGVAPSQLIEQELRRLRQLLEAGETATISGQSAGGRRASRSLRHPTAEAIGVSR